MLNIQITGDRELIARFTAMPDQVRRALLKKVTQLALQLESKIKTEKLSGQVLHVVSGKLRASIFNEVTQTGDSTIGKAASSGDVKYAAIHEFGGTIEIPEIVAKGKALAFMQGGKMAFYKKVAAHTVTMPERSFMRSSLADMKDQIIQEMTDAVREGVQVR
jgi:HK97 gp10 family phage protein